MTKKIFAILALFLLALVGCQQQAQTGAGKAFVGGTEGLSVRFLSGLPPAEVFDTDSPFQIALEVENNGEFNIDAPSQVNIKITGINPSDFGTSVAGLSAILPNPLKGASIDVGSGNKVEGEITTVDSFSQLKYQKTVSGSAQFPLRANLCYEYGTQAQGKLCVRSNLRTAGSDGICNPTRTIAAESSGAPVQITNVRQTVSAADRVDFFFTIKQSGNVNDKVYKTGTTCDPNQITTEGVVYVEVENTGLGELSCSGLKDGSAISGYINLIDGQREVRCSQKIDSPSDFEKIVNIKLKYAYSEYVDTTLTVKQSR